MVPSIQAHRAHRAAAAVAIALLAACCLPGTSFVAGSIRQQLRGAQQTGLRPSLEASSSGAGAAVPAWASFAASSLLAATAVAAAAATARRGVSIASRRGGFAVRLAADGRMLRVRDRADGHGWVKEDPEFDPADASAITATHTVELKKRPSGILRYTHAEGQGAMVAAMHEKGRYPGDPWGQAAVAGVKNGYVVKSINGMDVRTMDFEDIMDMLEDFIPDPDVQSTAAFGNQNQRERKFQKVDFPVTMEFMEMKEGAKKATGPVVPEGAWMPRLAGWSNEDLAKERQRVATLEDAPAGYTGPRYTGAGCIDDNWIRTLMNHQGNLNLLPKKDAYMMVLDVIDLLRKEKTLGEIEVKTGQALTIFGDLHGQYFDFYNMLQTAGLPSADRPFLFNGDFVDRGSWSIEVILLIFAMKLKSPGSVFMNRGNHEMLETNLIYGFAGECGAKYDMDIFNLFSETFRNLPLLHLVNKEVLVVHAGVPGPMPRVWLPGQTHDPEDAVPVNERCTTLADIAQVDRYTELTPDSFKGAVDDAPRQEEKWETDTRMIIDFLWADPRGGVGYGPSYRKSRGIFMFGPDVTEQFVKTNNLSFVVRSHEVKSEGFKYDHPQLLAVFSAPNYLDTGGNKGAFLHLTPTGPGGKLEAKPTSFDPVPHPDLPPMHYQGFIAENFPHLTRKMKKKVVSTGDDFGDSDFAGYQGPDEWEEA